jgi:hypothetical protein
MKTWQRGYPLEQLLAEVSKFERYNQFCLGPFIEVKKNDIANYLAEGQLHEVPSALCYRKQAVKAASAITMYPREVQIGMKEKGDTLISRIALNKNLKKSDEKRVEKHLTSLGENVWFECMSEDAQINRLLEQCGEYVGTKVSTFGELQSYYFRGKRKHPEVMEMEKTTICELDLKEGIEPLIQSIKQKLDVLPEFANHHSNYNKKKAWSAVSLKGYSNDVHFIGSPNEKKVRKKYGDSFTLQETALMNEFPEVRKIIKLLGGNVERVRFMKLRSGEGELTRHTDLEDKVFGVTAGKVMRLHFPIITNDRVEFTMWNLRGEKEIHRMKVGKAYYLDTRKPHSAINRGKKERIHLVIDNHVN